MKKYFRRAAAGLLCLCLLSGCVRIDDPVHPPETNPSTEAQGTTLATQPPETAPPQTQPPETAPPQTQPPETEPPETQPPETEPPDPVEGLLQAMTLEEMVGQLFMVRPEDLDPEAVTQATDGLAQALERWPVGGLILFARNIETPEQLTSFTADLQAISPVPLFLAVDEEGGDVARLANSDGFDLPQYESAGAVGSGGDPEAAGEMGRTIGGYLKEYGFNLDFAPVADVNTNPDNPVIGDRAFSSDPETAARMAEAMARGLNSQGVMAAFKHFPGHGDTGQDSHLGMAVTYKTEDEMAACEWIPFARAGWGDWVMVGHISAPAITGDDTPATLSRTLVTDILRGRLGFSGLVVTDALEMGAVTQVYSSGEAAVLALQAGCDVLLLPADLPEAFDAVCRAVEDGTLSQARIQESVRRILEYKRMYGI